MTKTMTKTMAMALTAGLMLAGCRSQKGAGGAPAPTPQPDPVRYEAMTRSFSAMVEGLAVGGQMRWQRDSAIWVSASKFIEVGRARLTPDSLIAYIPPYNQYLRMDMDEVRRRFGMDFDSVQSLIADGRPELSLSLRGLSAPLQVRFSSLSTDPPKGFPVSIPPSAKPLNP